MRHDQSFVMKDISGTSLQSVEEQVGLLHTSGDDDRSNSEFVEDEEKSWDDKQETTQQYHKPRRQWIRNLFIASLLFCTIVVLGHQILARSGYEKASTTAPVRLRPEEDYILDSAWNFDAAPTTREYTWVIADHELNPDGVYRPMILINDTFPGPMIECNEDDEIVVHIHNRATNATSIHWHGLYQTGTNWMDGTVGVTQCPIAPGHSFTYRFNVTGQSGTYWYHSHVSMQASDGMVGPLIIHPRGGEDKALQKVPYEQDRVVMLSDHYYDLSSQLLMQYLEPGSENDEPVPPSALINGRNVRNCSDLPNRNCSSTGISNALFDLSTDNNTRLRIINVGAFAEFQLQIDEHEFQVTEVDGTDVYPQSIHRLNINPAQRYSIIVSPPPNDKNKGAYWMRARMITHCFAYEEPELQEEVRGVLHYDIHSSDHKQKIEQQTLIPQSKDWSEIIEVECRDLNTSSLSPVLPISAPDTADHTIYLRSSFQIHDWRLSRGFLNDSSFKVNATSPILHTFLDASQTSEKGGEEKEEEEGINTSLFNPKSQLIHQTSGIRTIDILIQNMDDGNHPFHLHGYKFWVMAQGHGYAPALHTDPSLYSSLHLNTTNPLRRDTASLEAYGWMLIRFLADNAGVWAFHCHIGWHAEAGLMMVFATRVDGLEKQGWGMQETRELCGLQGLEKGMGPDDGMWVGSFVNS
jgi:FtsP/CotA-like multicopper oxidase with cupredoxin domain